jgi:hypothetical protein
LCSGLLIGGDQITEASGGTHSHIFPATGQPNRFIPLAGAAETSAQICASAQHRRRYQAMMLTDINEEDHGRPGS